MTNFLAQHCKYDGSYANRVKFRQLGLTPAQMDAAYNLLSADENFWDSIDGISEFTHASKGYQTISSAGRSGGHLVLLDSYYKPTEYKSVCQCCGQRNYKRVADPVPPGSAEAVIREEVARSQASWSDTVYLEQSAIKALGLPDEGKLDLVRKAKIALVGATIDNKCGVCGTEGPRGRVNYTTPPVTLQVSNKGTADDPEEMADWTLHALRERVRIVREFDRACDRIRAEFIDLLDTCQVVDETMVVTETVRRIQCCAA